MKHFSSQGFGIGRITMLLFFISLSIMLSNCQKEVVGPQGTQGNANVKSSTINVSNWIYSDPSYYADISVPDITQDIIDRGAVLVYGSNGSGGFIQLPITLPLSANYSTTFEVVSSVGKVRIIMTDSDLTQPNAPGIFTIKIVVISAAMKAQHPALDYGNFEIISKQLSI